MAKGAAPEAVAAAAANAARHRPHRRRRECLRRRVHWRRRRRIIPVNRRRLHLPARMIRSAPWRFPRRRLLRAAGKVPAPDLRRKQDRNPVALAPTPRRRTKTPASFADVATTFEAHCGSRLGREGRRRGGEGESEIGHLETLSFHSFASPFSPARKYVICNLLNQCNLLNPSRVVLL